MAGLTLAQRLAEIESTLPQDYDPEDLYGGTANEKTHVEDQNQEDEGYDPNVGREHYVEVGPSTLRRINENLNDPKYEGVKISRNNLVEDEDEEDDDADNQYNGTEDDPPSTGGDSLSEEEEESILKKQPKRSRSEEPQESPEDLDPTLQKTRVADKLKGQAVSRQLRIWDALVDCRIQLQKAVSSTNKLPSPQVIPEYTNAPEIQPSVRQYLSQAFRLSQELFQLRRVLLEQSGLAPPPSKRQRMDLDLEADDVDYETLFKESVEEMMDFEAEIHPANLSTLQKWSAKVQAVAPSALLPSSKVSFKNGPARTKSAAELVDEAMKDPEKLLKNTWSRVNRISSNDKTEVEGDGDEETFDDREFYQSMLRDVIESKGGKEAIADLYSNSKKQRKKKSVDTKASKGRKLRYEPHEKILNFMVPISVKGAWQEEQIDELFASLLGKGFEDGFKPSSNETDITVVPEQSSLQGFRIFG